MIPVDLKLVSCLEKVFIDEEPRAMVYAPEGLRGEEAAFQLAWKARFDPEAPAFNTAYVTLEIESPIRDYISVRKVRHVPVRFTCFPDSGEGYLRKAPGMYPDPLDEFDLSKLQVTIFSWECVWISINPADELAAGSYPIKMRLVDRQGVELASAETTYTLIDVRLPKQTLIHTRWFHNDGLCHYYNVEMFSEEFWRIAEEFVKGAVDMSVNCLLTPVHTPPLDTAVGGERLTCQLVDVEKQGDKFIFGFDKLHRWVEMAQRCGIEYFEIAHFFSQWGASFAPKIMGMENGKYTRLFGWDNAATGPEYTAFLKQYVPALREELTKMGIVDKCIFHISDEPHVDHLENYMKARSIVSEALKGLPIVDALSHIELYNAGAVEHPVPSINHIKPFLEAKIPWLWCYYCVGQHKDVSNAFLAMPSARTRIIGVQMYKYDIKGFLQWGYNFYNSQYSEYPINPWYITDGDGFSPAGDCYLVYPGADGKPVPSLRSKVFAQAIYDMRALQLLESYIGKDEVMRIVEDGIAPIEFDAYPMDSEYLFSLRRRVNAKLAEVAAK